MRRLGTLCASLILTAGLAAFSTPPAIAGTAAGTPAAGTQARLQAALDALAERARPGRLGIAVRDLSTGASWQAGAGTAYPMMSVFKLPLAAAVLAQVEQGRLSLQQQVTIERADVIGGSAVPSIGARFRGERMRFSVDQLLTAAVSESDNTAADALMKTAGGAGAVTAFLREHGIDDLRVDLDEAGIGTIFQALPPGAEPPAGETDQHRLERLRRGYQAFLADPRNRSTPAAAADLLAKLWNGQLLPPAPTRHLLRLMYAQTVPNRLRRGVPATLKWADKTGTSSTLEGRTAAYNDIGILTWPDGRTVIVAAFLMDSPTTADARDALFADLGRTIVTALGTGGHDHR